MSSSLPPEILDALKVPTLAELRDQEAANRVAVEKAFDRVLASMGRLLDTIVEVVDRQNRTTTEVQDVPEPLLLTGPLPLDEAADPPPDEDENEQPLTDEDILLLFQKRGLL